VYKLSLYLVAIKKLPKSEKKGVYRAVPNQRASGQKQVIVVMKEEFLEKIDSNLEAMGFGDRAQFIRQAVREKLMRYGVSVSLEEIAPPSRAGKGGRPRTLKAVEEKKRRA
jgi:Arc/MetJ-type ribon-helix-helix transcriptional regulator